MSLLPSVNDVGKFALNVAGTVVDPLIEIINKGLAEQAKASKNTKAKGNIGEALKQGAQTLSNTVVSPEAGRATADIASLAVPFGRGAGIVQKAMLPGAAVGGLSETAQPGATPESVVGSTVAGAVLPTIGGVLGKVGNKISGNAKQVGNKFLQGQYDVQPKIARNIDIPTAVAKLADYGHTSLNDVAAVAPKVTGRDGIITKMTKDAVSKANPVNLGDILGQSGQKIGNNIYDVADTLINQGDFIPETAAKKFRATLENGIKNISGSNVAKADPAATFDLIKSFESKAAQYRGTQDIGSKQLGDAYKGIAEELKDRLFNQAGADNMIAGKVLSSENIAKLYEISPKLAQDAMSAKTVGALRSLAAPYVHGSKLAQDTMDRIGNKNISLPQVLEILHTAGTGNPAGLILAAAQTNAGKNFLGKSIRGIGDTANKISGASLPSIGKQALGQAEARLPMIATGTQPNTENNNQNTQDQNHSGTISQSITDVNSIPKTIGDIKPDQNGNFSVASPFAIKGADGASLALSPNEYQTQVSQLNDQKTKLNQETSDHPYDPGLAKTNESLSKGIDNQIDSLNTKQNVSQGLGKAYEATNSLNNAATDARGLLASAPPNLFQLYPSIEKLREATDPTYRQLAVDLDAIATHYPAVANSIFGAKTAQAARASLDKANQQFLNDYHQTLIGFSGGSSGTKATNEVSTRQTPSTVNTLPSIRKSGGNFTVPQANTDFQVGGLPPIQ